MSKQEQHEFQTEVNQLLNLMINALYSKKEIFLRELISNASDALDKLRFNAISNEKLKPDSDELAIWIEFDKEGNTISIRDNGIGMSKEEVIANIGTIANSGTKKFLESMTGDQAKDSQLIGQFGVGFYSSFIVADKVVLETRKAGETSAICWESTGEGGYTLEDTSLPVVGTVVTLHLKEDSVEFLDNYRLRSIITTYSNHINFPIYLEKPPEPEKDDDKQEVEQEENKDITEANKWEQVNSASALWTKAKSELKDEDYNEFYKSLCMDYQDSMLYSHNRVEGTNEYISLLYIPKKAPFDLWDRDRRYGLKLYVKRIFIMENAEALLPNYLRFVRGIIDSDDLPLNVSREILQNNKLVDNIKTGNTKRVLKMLNDLANEEDKSLYQNFWQEFGQVIKEGIVEDVANKDDVAKLLRLSTTRNADGTQNVSLEDYVTKMLDGQENIYYITGENYATVASSPHLEAFKKANIEVLLLVDRIDEWVATHLKEYQGKTLKSITRGELDDFLTKAFTTDENKDEKEVQKSDGLIKKLEEALDGKIKNARITNRLTDSPACLVADETDMDANMQRIMQQMGQSVPTSVPIMEINMNHAFIKKVSSLRKKEDIKDWANLLFSQARLVSGSNLENPTEFVSIMNKLLVK